MLFKGLDFALMTQQYLSALRPAPHLDGSADTWRNSLLKAANTFVYSKYQVMARRCYMRAAWAGRAGESERLLHLDEVPRGVPHLFAAASESTRVPVPAEPQQTAPEVNTS